MSAQMQVYTALEKVVMEGNLESLSPDERLHYYEKLCASLGLNPLTRPFDYIRLNGKLSLYAKKDATEQLRKLQNISIRIVDRQLVEDLYIVTARAENGQGRFDESVGAVNISGLKGEMKANAIMKAETKAKRRVTLSISGLGMLDESETPSIPGAKLESVDMRTGEIHSVVKALPIQLISQEIIDNIDDLMSSMAMDEAELNQWLSAMKGQTVKVELSKIKEMTMAKGKRLLDLLAFKLEEDLSQKNQQEQQSTDE